MQNKPDHFLYSQDGARPYSYTPHYKEVTLADILAAIEAAPGLVDIMPRAEKIYIYFNNSLIDIQFYPFDPYIYIETIHREQEHNPRPGVYRESFRLRSRACFRLKRTAARVKKIMDAARSQSGARVCGQ